MFRRHLTFPNIVALICLFVVLGGPAVAADTVKRALFAKKAGSAHKVDGFHASGTPKPRTLLALDSQGRFPQSVLPPGLSGATGQRGATGERGASGERGPAGEAGAAGAKGDAGAKGEAGAKGDPGTDGTSFFWRGEWDELAGYVAGDAVRHLGAAYIATGTSTGNPPSDEKGWDLMAAAGADGAPGATGPAGPAGAAGSGPPAPPPPNYDTGTATAYETHLTVLGPTGETIEIVEPNAHAGCRVKRLPRTDPEAGTTAPGEYEDCHFTLLGFPESVREWYRDHVNNFSDGRRSLQLRRIRWTNFVPTVTEQLDVADAFLSRLEIPDFDEAGEGRPGVIKIVAVPRRITAVTPTPVPARASSRAAPVSGPWWTNRWNLTIPAVTGGTIYDIGRLAIESAKLKAPAQTGYVQFAPGAPVVEPFTFGTSASTQEPAPTARTQLRQWGSEAESGAPPDRDLLLELFRSDGSLHTALNIHGAIPLVPMSTFDIGLSHPMTVQAARVAIG